MRDYEAHELPDPRNAEILVWVGDGLVPRSGSAAQTMPTVANKNVVVKNTVAQWRWGIVLCISILLKWQKTGNDCGQPKVASKLISDRRKKNVLQFW